MKTKRPFTIGNARTILSVGRNIPRALGLSLVAVVIAAGLNLTPVFAAEQGSDLDKLETKFFRHTYPKDTSDARLDRLEKMVFGEAKEGPDRDRLDSLLKMVPEGGDETADSGTTGGGSSSAAPAKRGGGGSQQKTASTPAPREDDGTQYPAVTAIEQKLLGRNFEGEPVEDRLTRLEKKAFGKQSASNDLSERMDVLKSKTGIDIARRGGGSGGDWNDEDEEDGADYPEPSQPVSRRYPGVSPSDSGRSFSGRDIAGDLNRAFNRGGTASGGSGSYGMSGSSGGGFSSSSGGSGSYGFGGGSSTSYGGPRRGPSQPGLTPFGTPARGGQYSAGRRPAAPVDPDDDSDGGGGNSLAYTPPSAPTFQRGQMPPTAPPRGAAGAQAGGLAVQIDALETQVFGKTYHDPLIQRLERLETTVFPGDKTARARTPAERINRLTQVIPIGGTQPMAQNNLPQTNPQDLDGDGNIDQQQMPDQSALAQQPRKSRGGLGKMINSLGNFLGGGMAVGSYPMASGNLVTDPATGMLLDQYSGNLINPTTGQVVGRKAGFGYPSAVPNYGVNFNNGFSPYSPYSNPMYGNPMYGIGGSGIRFGTGGIRFGGGMWP